MASEFSFDIVSEVNLQEVDNAVNQALKEIQNRFDFKGSKSTITLNREEKKMTLLADDDMKLKSLTQTLQEKYAKRGISIKAFKNGEIEKALDGMLRQTIEIIQGIPQETAKEIVQMIKGMKTKVQSSIQSDKVRVTSKDKDLLQEVIHAVRGAKHFNVPLQFTNYR